MLLWFLAFSLPRGRVGLPAASMLPVSLPLVAPEGPVTVLCWGGFKLLRLET